MMSDNARPLAANDLVTSRNRHRSAGNPSKVLVLLASYNGADWIDSQVDSILQQSDVNVTLRIADDVSTDDTAERVSRLADGSRVELTVNSRPTKSAGQNFFSMIRSSSSDGFSYIAFSDQDDIWFNTKLRDGCRALAGSEAVGYSAAVVASWPDGTQSLMKQSAELTQSDFLFEGAGQGCTFILTANFYERIRKYITENSECTKKIHYHDWAVYALARSWGESWSFDPIPQVQYRQHDKNDTGARQSIRGILKRLGQIRSGWYSDQLRAIATLCLRSGSTLPSVSRWENLLSHPAGIKRRCMIAWFCSRGGRRRRIDNAILVASALFGWI